MVTVTENRGVEPTFSLKVSQSSVGLVWKQNRLSANSQFMPKPARSVPQHIVLACIHHFSPHESLRQSCFIKAKTGCFLQQSILLHIGLFFHITENSNEGHRRVTAAVLSAILYYSCVAIAIWSNAMQATRAMMWLCLSLDSGRAQ